MEIPNQSESHSLDCSNSLRNRNKLLGMSIFIVFISIIGYYYGIIITKSHMRKSRSTLKHKHGPHK